MSMWPSYNIFNAHKLVSIYKKYIEDINVDITKELSDDIPADSILYLNLKTLLKIREMCQLDTLELITEIPVTDRQGVTVYKNDKTIHALTFKKEIDGDEWCRLNPQYRISKFKLLGMSTCYKIYVLGLKL